MDPDDLPDSADMPPTARQFPDMPPELAAEIIDSGDTPQSLRSMARYVYNEALHSLGLRIHGHPELVETLALAVSQHMITPASAQRLTLIGPSGSGKTTAAMALADCLRRPVVRISMEDVTATGWSGTSIGDCLGDIDSQASELAIRGFGTFHDIRAQAVVIIDEIDKVATGKHEGVSWSHQIQKQQSLLGLLSKNGQVVSSPDLKTSIATRTLSTQEMLIVSCGVFDGLPAGRDPGPEDLIALGLLPELVERMGALHRLKPLAPEQLLEIFKEGLEPTCEHYAAYGYLLVLTREALLFTGQLVGRGRGGPRSGTSWLCSAADRGLSKLLREDAPVGTVFTLTPDDIRVAVRQPEPSRDPEGPSSPPTPVW